MTVKIEIEFASMGEANAVRAWAAIQRGQATYLSDAKKLSAETLKGAGVFTTLDGNARKTFDSMRKGVGGVSREFAGFAAGLIGAGGLREAVRMVQDATHRMLEEAKAAGMEYERLFKRFGSQASLQGTPLQNRAKDILDVAFKRATPEEKAFDAATQLRSSGFNTDEAAGGSLNSFLKTLNATNQGGKEPVAVPQLVEAMASYFAAQNLDKNTKNMDRVGVAFQRLFAEGQVQFPDFQQFAAESVGMRGKLSIEEQMAAFASMREVMPGDEAATGLSRFVTRTASMKTEEGNVSVLASMGLKPEDVDLVGERFDEVLAKYKEGLAKLKPEDRTAALRQLFDMKGMVAAENLINLGTNGTFQKFMGVQGQRTEYEQAANLMETGPNAARQRQEIASKRRAFEKDQGLDLIMAELQAIAKEQGVTPVAIDNGLARLKDAIGLMGDNEANVRKSANVIFGPEMYERAKGRVERLKAGKSAAIEDTPGSDSLESVEARRQALRARIDQYPFNRDRPRRRAAERELQEFEKRHAGREGEAPAEPPPGQQVSLITSPIQQRRRPDIDMLTADTGGVVRQMMASQRALPVIETAQPLRSAKERIREDVIERALDLAEANNVKGISREGLEESAAQWGDDTEGFSKKVRDFFYGHAERRREEARGGEVDVDPHTGRGTPFKDPSVDRLFRGGGQIEDATYRESQRSPNERRTRDILGGANPAPPANSLNPLAESLKTIASLQRDLLNAFNRGPDTTKKVAPTEVVVKLPPPIQRPNYKTHYVG